MQLTHSDVKNNIQKLQSFMKSQGLTHCYLSSTDPYLNEYVPMELCHRYYFTLFTGSTAEVLAPAQGRIQLFVDGRYHEQAHQQVDCKWVEVVEVEGKGLKESVLEALPASALLGHAALRTPLKFAKQIAQKCPQAQTIDGPLSQLIHFARLGNFPIVENLEGKVDITPVEQKIRRIYQDFEQSEAIYLSALDQIAWISNLRGYHLPYLSSFLARAILTSRKLHLFVTPDIQFESLGNHIEVHQVADGQLAQAWAQHKDDFQTLYYDEGDINSFDHATLVEVFGQDRLAHREGGLIPYMSIKDEKEQALIIDSFANSNRAITEVLRWIRSSMAAGVEISELDIYHKTTECYRQQGAKSQSFQTISGVGPHSSIIHFSSPEDQVKVRPQDVILIDSGGYFASGFATDTTRTILAHRQAKPERQLVEIYTYALQGMLRLQNAVVKEGTLGDELDQIARGPIQERGYDYGHGTGHGVGVYVHEGGISFSSRSSHHQVKAGQVVSVEPGIYIPGLGGVRHENIVLVRPHSQKAGYVYFEPLTWIEFDESLLDRSLLTPQELQWFDDYQAKCLAQGNSFSVLPSVVQSP